MGQESEILPTFSFKEMQAMAASGAQEQIMQTTREYRSAIRVLYRKTIPILQILGHDINDTILAGNRMKSSLYSCRNKSAIRGIQGS